MINTYETGGFIGQKFDYDSPLNLLTTGLVIYLDASNKSSNPGTGSTWYDLSGRGNHASLTTGALTEANYGSANFDGSTYYTIPFNATDFTFNTEQTIMISLRAGENDASRRNPYNQAYAGAGTWTHETDGTFNYYYGTTGTNGASGTYQNIGSTVAVGINEWVIMATTRLLTNPATNGFVRWYRNGSLYSSTVSTYTSVVTGTFPILIGAGYTSNYIGNIDVVLVYNKALTTAEVLYNSNILRKRYNI